MRLLFYSRENTDRLVIISSTCDNTLSFEYALAEIYIHNDDLESFKESVNRIADCLQSTPDGFYRVGDKWKIGRLFYASKRLGRSYNFRLHLVKTFIEHGVYMTTIIDNFHFEYKDTRQVGLQLNIDV